MAPKVLTSTNGMSEADWLEFRRTAGIGASEAAACAGIDPWTSPISLVLRKLGQLPAQPETPAMYWGKVLEAVVADEFAKRHPDLRVRKRPAVLQSTAHPWMTATLDREVDGLGAVEPLECKTANAWAVDDWDEPPVHYVLQVQHQLHVRESQVGWLAVLIGGSDYREWRVEYDAELLELLIPAEQRIWQHVQDETLPEPDSHRATTEALAHIYGVSVEEPVELGRPGALAIDDYDRACAEVKAAEAAKDDAANRLRYLLAEHEIGTVLGEKVVTWKPQSTTRLDTKAIRAAHPDLVAEFERTTEGRVLRRAGKKAA